MSATVGAFSASFDYVHFERLLNEEASPSPHIRQLHQDKEGFIWLLTHNTAQRFDGANVTRFPNREDSPKGLSSGKANRIASDAAGNVWILQTSGLSKYNPDTRAFELFEGFDADGLSLTRGAFALKSLPDGTLAIGAQRGLFIFDPRAKEWTRSHENIGSGAPWVRDFAIIDETTLLAACGTGLWQYDFQSGEFSRFQLTADQSPIATDLNLRRVLLDSQKRLWLCEQSGPIHAFQPDGTKIDLSIGGSPLEDYNFRLYLDIFEDGNGNIWAAPAKGGLIVAPPGSTDFTSFESTVDGFDSPIDYEIIDIAELDDGTLCFSTQNGGVLKTDPQALPVRFYTRSQRADRLQFSNIRQLEPSRDGRLWVLGPVNRISLFDPQSSRFQYPLETAENAQAIARSAISSVAEDLEGRLIMLVNDKSILRFDPSLNRVENVGELGKDLPRGTQNTLPTHIEIDESGALWLLRRDLVRYDIEKRLFHVISPDEDDPNFQLRSRCLAELPNGDLWIGTQQRGLHYYSKSEDRITLNLRSERYPELFRYDSIYDIATDSKHRPWIGTTNGLAFLDTEAMEFETFDDVPELAGNSIYGIDFDENGALWISASNGLLHFDPEKRQARRYTSAQGFAAQSFAPYAFFDLGDDLLVIGGRNGINVFDTNENLTPSATPSPTFLSASFTRASDRETRSTISISKRETAIFKRGDRQLSFAFAPLLYSKYSNVVYRYRIDGLSSDWSEVSSASTVDLASLPPGDFTLRLKAFGFDGTPDSAEAKIALSVAPPFWQSASFLSLSVAGGLAMVIAFIRVRTRTVLRRNRDLEAKVAARTKELDESRADAIAANKAKSDFLACMSHEIRTPMNGIVSMNQLMMQSGLSPKLAEYAEIVDRSAESLLTLINDILDFSKIEAGAMELEAAPFNLRELVEDTAELLLLKAQEKGLKLICLANPTMEEEVVGDSLRLRQAVTNLIGNAIKFTREGSISVSINALREDNESIVCNCSVKDTGIGIPADQQAQLFEAFTQADSSTSRKYGGTGLGLSITKRIVDAMDGRIELFSDEGHGTEFRFTVRLKVGKKVSPKETMQEALSGKGVFVCLSDEKEAKAIGKWLEWSGAKVVIEPNVAMLATLIADRSISRETSFENLLIERRLVDAIVMRSIETRKRDGAFRVMAPFEQPSLGALDPSVAVDFSTDSLIHPLAIIRAFQSERGHAVSRNANDGISSLSINGTPPSALIVDDSAINRRILRAVLEQVGCLIEEATDGQEAIDLTTGNDYDIIFMDCMMPVMNGYEATKRIRSGPNRHNRKTPIVALTANAMKGDKDKCLRAGMNDYNPKPVRLEDLNRLLLQWLPERIRVENDPAKI